ncbi:MAG: flagellar protein FliS [Rubripirellula sp.]|nr:flagellar protein FliS [Rubripirellula sp.]
MTNHAASARFTNQGRSSRSSESYLESMVNTASPARLRLLLLERAVDVAGNLATIWKDGKELGSNQHSLKLLELLNELLSGVVGGPSQEQQKICHQVSDLYVFLTQHLMRAEETSDCDAINQIASILQTEAETWRTVCGQQSGQQASSAGIFPSVEGGVVPSEGLNLQA